MKRICIIHPEGNLNNNPNLFGIVEILCEEGFRVDLYCHKREHLFQESLIANLEVYIEDSQEQEKHARIIKQKRITKYDLIIGIDHDGIIEASSIAENQNIPLGFFSYELFFADEIGEEAKMLERDACRRISFATVQDEIRGKILCNENNISKEKLIYIPVAGRNTRNLGKDYFLHDSLGIGREKKIAIHIGSIARWTMVEELIESTKQWPDNWVLVMHCIHDFSELKQYCDSNGLDNKVYFSSKNFNNVAELQLIIRSAAVGLAFYKPTFKNRYEGKNIENIGLSSGKISTYLQYGLPVITNDIEPLNEYIRQNKIGRVVNNIDDLGQTLKDLKTESFSSENIKRFYLEYLDLNKSAKPLVAKITELITREAKIVKLALIKQVVLPDLYVCGIKENIDDILFSSIMRVGPIGLFKEFNTDFYIVNEDKAKECQIWKEINQTPLNGQVELLYELKNKLLNEIPGQEFKQPGSNFPNGHYAVDLGSIDWGRYDIVISVNISVPSSVVKKHPKTLWCYMLMEPNILTDKVYFNYDVSLNHHISGIPYYYPGIIDFPYTYAQPGLINSIFEKYLGRKSLRNKIYIDISCSKNKSEEKLVENIPEKLLALKKTNFELVFHNQNIRNNLENIFDSKYSVKIGGSYIRGNSVIESISAGSLFIGDPALIAMNNLLPPECRVKNVKEATELIDELEKDPEKYKELWWMQKTMARFYVIDQPTASLLNILSYKRKYGPLKNNLKRKIIRYSKKTLKKLLL